MTSQKTQSTRYLVTGANGFIGRPLCERLAGFGRVRALVRRDADGPWHESLRVDLTSDALPEDALEGVDVVFHLAAKTHDIFEAGGDDREYERINVDGTRGLLEALQRAGVPRLVFMSSVKAMGEATSGADDEKSTPRPESAYGRTKLAAEKLVLEGGFVEEPVVLRLPLVYGPGVRGNLARMIDAIDRGRFPPVPDVNNRRSLVHVSDVVDAAVLASQSDAAGGRVFIVTDGRSYSTRDMYVCIRRALGKPEPTWSIPVFALKTLASAGTVIGKVRGRRWMFDREAYGKLLGSAHYDSTALEQTLGFKAKWDLDKAMPAIVESLRRGDGA